MTLLSVQNLAVEFATPAGPKTVIHDVSIRLDRHETLGFVGESGSGKSVTSLAVLGLIGQRHGRITGGRIMLDGQDITHAPESVWRGIRGKRIGMIFQQPILSLNPSLTVGSQIAETVRRHLGLDRRAAWTRAVEMMDRVGIHEPQRRALEYPHMFSGGMAQRVMIAQALSCGPDLLIADEPTTALDVTVQAKVLDLLVELQQATGMGLILISHDLAVVSQMSDRIVVMQKGRIVDQGPCPDLLHESSHPYTRALIEAIPEMPPVHEDAI
ncbi:MAG: ABC transporter ATP-binding protein [Paracoccus sp. (in: a-proteobacteria)]|uniref:ABC transporter ATP-binding protein n=1 Tax=Paracoccus sp. TaxID=267 RepID=UPI0039E56F3B